MSESPLIKLEGVSKKFCRHLKRSLWYGLQDVGREMIGRERSEALRRDEFWAVDDVSFEVNRGEILGLVGHNGCGKTTLLRLINGLIMPDKGLVTIRGQVGALIQLGAGFSEILSGRENIHINAAVLGIPTQEVNRKLDDIIEFANIGEFIEAPVRTYSSGMRARLGFAVAIHMNPDILLVDEVLAVGDIGFRARAMERMLKLANSGVAVVFISHNLGQVNRLCHSAVLMKQGQLIRKGPTTEVLAQYVEGDQAETGTMQHQLGTQDFFTITKASLSVGQGPPVERISTGDPVTIRFTIEAKREMDFPLFSLIVEPLDKRATALFINQARDPDQRVSLGLGAHVIEARLAELPLLPGRYSMNMTVFGSKTSALRLGQVDGLINFIVEPKPDQLTITNQAAFVALSAQWEWDNETG
ncbi:MAG: ABC transporter ATP-binding protein [Magnetococcales bacterium]|nr:ABC transporter ATP-binding protein [Magnetococcales bacterium]